MYQVENGEMNHLMVRVKPPKKQPPLPFGDGSAIFFDPRRGGRRGQGFEEIEGMYLPVWTTLSVCIEGSATVRAGALGSLMEQLQGGKGDETKGGA